MYIMRFDMRAPDTGAAIATLYSEALEMAAWAESRGCLSAMVSEHHAASDNYLPSPLLLASAMAARTQTLPISVAALLLNMYDPIKLAEDMAVLDILSQGRVGYVIGLGYRDEEYALFGVDVKQRAAVIEEKLGALLSALRGEEVSYQGRSGRITPLPQSPALRIAYGGHSPAAARRAGRYGLDFFANGGDEALAALYRESAQAAGHEPGDVVIPVAGAAQCVFVAEDVDAAWAAIGPHMLHDAMMYRAWEGRARTAVTSFATTVDELRQQEQGPYRILTPEQAVAMIQAGAPLMLHPLVGGCPPELGWQSLELIVDRVLPALET